jgi:DNA-directed RNA polymerase specialized sigma24 family protein
MADSLQTSWPALDAPYIDEFGCIDKDIHEAAGEIWRWAATFAIATIGDEASGHLALKKVCAKITEKRAVGAIRIVNLNAYIQTAFKHEVLAQLKRNRSANIDLSAESITDYDPDIDQKILVEQILARMNSEDRRITELLILGYSFEEIARKDGIQSNVIRSRHSKLLKRIKRELNVPN